MPAALTSFARSETNFRWSRPFARAAHLGDHHLLGVLQMVVGEERGDPQGDRVGGGPAAGRHRQPDDRPAVPRGAVPDHIGGLDAELHSGAQLGCGQPGGGRDQGPLPGALDEDVGVLGARGHLHTALGVRRQAGHRDRPDPREVGGVGGAVDLGVRGVLAGGQPGVGQRSAVRAGDRATLGVVVEVGQGDGSAADGPGVLTCRVGGALDVDASVAVHIRAQVGRGSRRRGEGRGQRGRQHRSRRRDGEDGAPYRRGVYART
ncbi:hypothetical protein SGLAM104S_05895 [Streptomyces glaucescens]